MPDLAIVEAIASDTPTRTVVLSGISTAVLLSALDAANRWFDWFIDEKQVSYSQYADVLGYLAQARYELMTTQIGEVRISAATEIPPGCLLCDGATYAKADYPALYSVLATQFILDDESFKTPDLVGKFVYGTNDASDVGTTGGEATHTLSIDEIATHSHSIPATTTTLAVEPGEIAVTTPIPIITSNTGDTGGGQPHNNIPPFQTFRFYIVAL